MHLDLKSANLLLSDSKRVRVADFGTAALVNIMKKQDDTKNKQKQDDTESAATCDTVVGNKSPHPKRPGTTFWMAPEILAAKADQVTCDPHLPPAS